MRSWHFVGICGIGMSALAQFAAAMQIKVSGSDRALENVENADEAAEVPADDIPETVGEESAEFSRDTTEIVSDSKENGSDAC